MSSHAKCLAAITTAVLALVAASECGATLEKLPNVLLIISDDQGWCDYGFMGHPHVETPRLDELARRSVVYRYGYAPSALCRPSLASIVTGLYPHQNQITSNDPRGATPAEVQKLREKQIANIDRYPSLPRLLSALGYKSMQTGKWWEGHFSRGGFTHGMTHGDSSRGGRHGDSGLTIGRQGIEPIREFLNEVDSEPFFIWYAPLLPHDPHNPPQRLMDKYRDKSNSKFVARYWAMCEWFDETCGELFEELDKRNLTDNTIIVYVTDNGWIQNRHDGKFDSRSKMSPYEGGVRTPIMVSWPGHMEPAIIDMPVSIIDVVPTVLAAVGLKPDAEMLGVNLLDQQKVAERDSIFGEVFNHDALDLDNPAASVKYRWCIEAPWKLIVPNAELVPDGQVELYNLLADPWETGNIAEKKPEVVRRLHQRLDAWWSAESNAAGAEEKTEAQHY